MGKINNTLFRAFVRFIWFVGSLFELVFFASIGYLMLRLVHVVDDTVAGTHTRIGILEGMGALCGLLAGIVMRTFTRNRE